MVLQVIFFPILSRIYAPEVYGNFSVFNAVVLIAGSILTLGYHRAIVLPEKERHFRALMRLSIRTVAMLSIVLLVLSILLGNSAMEWLNITGLGAWFYALAPLAFLMALDKLIVQWSIRVSAFRKVASIEVPLTAVSKLFNVGYGKFISAAAEGLILTSALMYAGRFILFVRWIFDHGWQQLSVKVSARSMREVKARYREYPRYILSSDLLSTASGYIPVLLLPVFSGKPDDAAFFSYALLTLDLPVRLLSSGIASVFLRKSTELWPHQAAVLQDRTLRLLYRLILVGVPAVIVLVGVGDHLYGFAFGERWATGGVIAGWLSISYFFRYLAMPIAGIFHATRRERELFRFQAALFIARLIGIVVPGLLGASLSEWMLVYSALTGIAYLILTLRALHVIGANWWRLALTSLGALFVSLVLGWLLSGMDWGL